MSARSVGLRQTAVIVAVIGEPSCEPGEEPRHALRAELRAQPSILTAHPRSLGTAAFALPRTSHPATATGKHFQKSRNQPPVARIGETLERLARHPISIGHPLRDGRESLAVIDRLRPCASASM
jgi:hypothetical protein